MIGLDTNVLVRYLAQDDPEQSARATALIEQGLTVADPGYIGIVAMVETVWVLDRAYRMGGTEIAAVVERLLQADTLLVEAAQEVFLAMVTLRDGRGGVRAHCDVRPEGVAGSGVCCVVTRVGYRRSGPRQSAPGILAP